jgi:hypothetical protein
VAAVAGWEVDGGGHAGGREGGEDVAAHFRERWEKLDRGAPLGDLFDAVSLGVKAVSFEVSSAAWLTDWTGCWWYERLSAQVGVMILK